MEEGENSEGQVREVSLAPWLLWSRPAQEGVGRQGPPGLASQVSEKERVLVLPDYLHRLGYVKERLS